MTWPTCQWLRYAMAGLCIGLPCPTRELSPMCNGPRTFFHQDIELWYNVRIGKGFELPSDLRQYTREAGW
jgi:hypothetical protein